MSSWFRSSTLAMGWQSLPMSLIGNSWKRHLETHIVLITDEVARRIGIDLATEELMEQLLLISRNSDGQLISTLQDLNSGKETEIDYLNLAISRAGAALEPPIDPRITRILGELVLAKSRIERSASLGTLQGT